MEYFILVPLWLAAGVVVGIIASTKGKSGCAWFIYGFLLAPVAFIHVLIASPEPEHRTSQALARGRLGLCPYCREAIKVDAVRCKHCGSDLSAGSSQSQVAASNTSASTQVPQEQTKVIVARQPRISRAGVLLLLFGLLLLVVTMSGRNGTRPGEPTAPSPPPAPTEPPSNGVVFAPPSPVPVPSSPPNPSLRDAFAGMTYLAHVAYESLVPDDPWLNLFEISADEAVGDDIGYRYFVFEGGRPGVALSDVCPAGYETTWFVFESDTGEPVRFSFYAEVHDLVVGDDAWFGPIFDGGFRLRAGDPLHQPPVYVAHCSFSNTRGDYLRSNVAIVEVPETPIRGSGPTLSCATYVTNLQNRRLLVSESGNFQVYCISEH